MTTAEIYRPPSEGSGGSVSTAVPEFLQILSRWEQAAAKAGIGFATTISAERAMSSARRALLLRELAQLSVDPNALDRDSEVDLWGLHDDG